MKNGTVFSRNYIPDENKKINGPIELDPHVDESMMRTAILKVAFWIAVLAGGVAFLFAITGGIRG